MMVVRGIRLAAAGIASAPRSLAGTRTVAPRCCHCVPVRRAAPGETLACIGGAYAVAPGRALAVAMGCYRLGVLAGIRRSRLAALAYGGLLYYPTPRQSALPLMRYLHQLRVGRSYLPVGLDRLES